MVSSIPLTRFDGMMNERDQLIVDLWMPAGTRLAGTDDGRRDDESQQ
jgi:hypothetical protein